MLSLDEAIARERKLAEIYRNDIVPKEDYHNMPWINMVNEGNEKAAEEHEQLAEWLEELKANKVTSAEVTNKHFSKIMSFINTNNRGNSDYFIVDQIENYIAEQLKEHNNETVL